MKLITVQQKPLSNTFENLRVNHKSSLSPGSSAGKEFTCNAGDPALIPGLGRSPGEGEGYPLIPGIPTVFWPGEFHELSMGSQRVGHD